MYPPPIRANSFKRVGGGRSNILSSRHVYTESTKLYI